MAYKWGEASLRRMRRRQITPEIAPNIAGRQDTSAQIQLNMRTITTNRLPSTLRTNIDTTRRGHIAGRAMLASPVRAYPVFVVLCRFQFSEASRRHAIMR